MPFVFRIQYKFKQQIMKPQEVISIIADISPSDLDNKGNLAKSYPELDQFFDKGMYIENIVQSPFGNRKCIITFVFRYYNTSQSKIS